MRRLIFTMTMRIRLDLVFVIQRRAIDVRAKEEDYVYVNFAVGKRGSSKVKDKDIARHLFSFTLMKMGIG